MRRLVCLFLLIFLPLHGLAVQGGWMSDQSVFDIAHEMDHLAAKIHHHDDDGSVHYDDSRQSASHFADHLSAQQSATLPSPAIPLPGTERCSIKPGEFACRLPDLVLDQPQRPPSATF